MALGKEKQLLPDKNVWVISKGRHSKLDLSKISDWPQTTFIKEYRISDLAKYLLNPNPIEVKKILVGCEVKYVEPFSNKMRNNFRKVLPKRMHGLAKGNRALSETLMADTDNRCLSVKDEDLNAYLEKIKMTLRAYNPLLRRLSKFDPKEIENIIGICEDAGGNRSLLNLKGDIEEKINYIGNYILKDVGVILERAHVSDGLFEMSGFDFSTYRSENSHRLIKFYVDGKPKFCVLGCDKKVEFWVDDIALIHQMHLLEHSIKENAKFSNSLRMCTKGDAKPLRLLFKKQLDIDYSKSPLPPLYKDIFETYEINSNAKDAVMKSLKNSQLGILFNFVPKSRNGEKKLFTNVSVMHDVRALDPLKDDLPELYSIINKMASVSEAGKYYLLDSIRGFTNE